MRSRKIKYAVLTVIVIISGLLVFHGAILSSAGRLMAPISEGKAEVVILEGEAVVKKGAVDAGMRLLSEGRARRIVVVLHRPSKENGHVFGEGLGALKYVGTYSEPFRMGERAQRLLRVAGFELRVLKNVWLRNPLQVASC